MPWRSRRACAPACSRRLVAILDAVCAAAASAVSVPTLPPLTSTPSVLRRHPHPLAQPVEHRELDRRGARAARPAAGERVVPGADQVGEDADRVARAADAGEEARVVGALAARQELVEQLVDRLERIARARRCTARYAPAAARGRRARSAAGRRAAPSGPRAGPRRDGRGGAARRAEGSAGPRRRQ